MIEDKNKEPNSFHLEINIDSEEKADALIAFINEIKYATREQILASDDETSKSEEKK